MSFSYDFAINPSHPWHVLWHSGAIVFRFLFFNSGVLASFISGRHSKCRFLFPVSTYPWLTSGTPPSTSKRCCLPHRICGIIKHFHRPYILLKFLQHKLFHYTFISLHIYMPYVAESSGNLAFVRNVDEYSKQCSLPLMTGSPTAIKFFRCMYFPIRSHTQHYAAFIFKRPTRTQLF